MYALIDTEDGGRMHGFSKVEVSTNNPRFDVVETAEDDLVAVFEQAKGDGETLDGADASIDAAIDDPLSFHDFLVLKDGKMTFDAKYTREIK
jgi:hypothetical protein